MEGQQASPSLRVLLMLGIQRHVRCQRAQCLDAHAKATRGDGGEPCGISAAEPAELVLAIGQTGLMHEAVDRFINRIFHHVFSGNQGVAAKYVSGNLTDAPNQPTRCRAH